ncbi:MAG: hypothetical protein A2817_00680 [Candidatus Yanofskybacteria bacterium RIFCSPHIGHO2_01_FULL_39_8b]|uniref:DUF350 domain-containing protein n=1 Tax=Candidatus Yanofskybacteria bacterium RIFCSPHIGHO2_01_FULL_39_8b TaxID=1802659 RepID=A0A1F8EBQ0_9BACT|nr:MAG: hypothetical protein A2817_00680 [Candidatus Yanofskybacteria bacterium RIFCSPHIGHO2_01_FULL_39_8b]
MEIIFRPIIIFTLVGSFSLFFMAGILTTKIQRNIVDETDEMKHLNGYTVAAFGGLVAGSISLVAMAFP